MSFEPMTSPSTLSYGSRKSSSAIAKTLYHKKNLKDRHEAPLPLGYKAIT